MRNRFEDIMDVRFQEHISMIDSIRKLSQEIQEKYACANFRNRGSNTGRTISSSTDLTDKFSNSDRQREILHKAITDLRDALQNDISVLSSQMAAIRDENTTLQGENTSLRITIVDREKTIELDKSEIGVLQKQLADNKETMVTKDTLEQAKLEIANLTEKYGMLESENMKLQEKLTIAIESRQQIEVCTINCPN
jgi:chromosome segregation ATPase